MPFATLEQKSKKSWLFSLHSDFFPLVFRFFPPGIQNDIMSLCEKNKTTWWATLLWFQHRDQHVQMQYLHTSLKYPSYWKRSIQIPIFLSILSTFGLNAPTINHQTERSHPTKKNQSDLSWVVTVVAKRSTRCTSSVWFTDFIFTDRSF